MPVPSSGSVELQVFWDLSSAEQGVRNAAAQRLVSALVKAQSADEGAPPDETTFGEEGALCTDLVYCLRRLVRGLASSRDGAREGFGLALTLTLRSFAAVDPAKLFAFALETLQVKGGGGSQEEKECGFGRLFLCLSLARAHRCEGEAAGGGLLAEKVAEELLRIQLTKSFVAEACSHALQVLISSLPAASVTALAPLLRARLGEVEHADMTPEQLELLITIDSTASDACPTYLLPANILTMAEPLKRSTSAHPRVHHVWDRVLAALARDGKGSGSTTLSSPQALKRFEALWSTVVEDNLLVSSHERKFLACLLLEKVVPLLPSASITKAMSPHMMRTLMNNMGKKKNLLRSAAARAMAAVTSAAQASPDTAADVLSFMSINYPAFDRATHSRTSQTLMEGLDAAGAERILAQAIQAYAAAPKNAPKGGEPDEEDESGGGPVVPTGPRAPLEAAYQLVARTWRTVLPADATLAFLGFLLHTALFSSAANAHIKTLAQERLFSLMESISSTTSAPGAPLGSRPLAPALVAAFKAADSPVATALKTASADKDKYLASPLAENPQIAWALRLHLLWDALEAQGGTLQPAAGVAAVARKGMWAAVKALRASSGEKGGEKGGGGKQAKGLTALFLFASVELVSDPAQAAGVLEELQTCRERIAPVKGSKGATPAKPDKSAKKSKKKAEEEEEDSDDEDEDPVAVLVEVLVSLLARPSALLRAVVRQAFRAFCEELSADALNVLIEVLNESGQELFVGEDEDGHSMDEDDDDSDEEEGHGHGHSHSHANGHAHGAGGGKKRAAADEDEEDDDSEEEEDEEEDDGRVAAAGGGDDDDWSDEKMFEMDDLVAAAFKSRLNDSKAAKQASAMSLVLKMRVLELIEVFLAHQKGSPLVMSLIEPLLDVCGGVGAERVGQSAQQRVSFNAKAATLFATRLCKPKSVPVLQTQEDREELVELVARLLSRLAQPHQGELVSPAIMLLLRIAGASAANGSKESLTPLLVAELTALLDKWAAKKHSNIRPTFFLHLAERQPAVAVALAPRAAELASDKDLSAFHRASLLEFILALVRQKQPLSDPAVAPHVKALMAALPAAVAASLEPMEKADKKVARCATAALDTAIKAAASFSDSGFAAHKLAATVQAFAEAPPVASNNGKKLRALCTRFLAAATPSKTPVKGSKGENGSKGSVKKAKLAA